jgi:hypothetical protein
LNEVKQNLVDDHIDKMKTDILNVVAKMWKTWLKMTLYGPKWPNMGQKWPKMAQKW